MSKLPFKLKSSCVTDDDDDDKHFMSSKPRPSNDISALLKMMMININQSADANHSQLAVNRNRRTVVDFSDSTDDDERLTQFYGKIKHFSHPHKLNKYKFQENSITNCNVCGLQLVGSSYGCPSCQFYVHESCFDLPQKIQHDAHPAHPLTLRYPSYYKHCRKTCNACREDITQSFLYCCDLCHFDLHVTCTTLYSIVKRPDGSTLKLYYTFPFYSIFWQYCDVCSKWMSTEGWSYYSQDTGRMAHINCAKGKLRPSWIKERLNMLKIN